MPQRVYFWPCEKMGVCKIAFLCLYVKVSQKIGTYSDPSAQLTNSPLCPTEHLCEREKNLSTLDFYLA